MAERDYTTRRSAIVNALVNKLALVDGAGQYQTSIANVEPRIKFCDEVDDFPCVHVSAGGEAREYLGAGIKHRFLTITLRCYVNEEDAVTALEKLLEDVETVIEANNPLVYTTLAGDQTALQTTVVSIDTDEGVLEPLGIGEIVIQVRY